jgi:hypothetical protein
MKANAPGAAAQAAKRPNGPDSNVLGVWDAGEADYKNIPPRGWLLGNTFCRGFVSALLAPGGVGKTALRLAQLVALATERNLTGEYVFQRCRVLLLSLEDDDREIKRRLLGLLRHHGIDPRELAGWLFVANPKTLKLALAGDQAPQIGPLYEMLCHEVATKQLGLVAIDPFVKSHTLDENSNGAIDFCLRSAGAHRNRTRLRGRSTASHAQGAGDPRRRRRRPRSNRDARRHAAGQHGVADDAERSGGVQRRRSAPRPPNPLRRRQVEHRPAAT